MKRNEHLRHCLICQNRLFDKQQGIICGLTNRIADFEKECDKFDFDTKEFKKISLKKIEDYGLGEKPTFFQELNRHWKTRTTDFTVFIKPRDISELPEQYHVQKSKVKYSLLSLITLTFFVISIVETINKGQSAILYGTMLVTMAVQAWILYNYRQKDTFIISSKGIFYRNEFISWNIIFGTVIMEVAYQGHSEKYLTLLLATNEDLKIKLNGLIGPTEKIENLVELYKKKYKTKTCATNN